MLPLKIRLPSCGAYALRGNHCLDYSLLKDGECATSNLLSWFSLKRLGCRKFIDQDLSQVLPFGGQNFCFYDVFETKFSWTQHYLGGTKSLGVTDPEYPPVTSRLFQPCLSTKTHTSVEIVYMQGQVQKIFTWKIILFHSVLKNKHRYLTKVFTKKCEFFDLFALFQCFIKTP